VLLKLLFRLPLSKQQRRKRKKLLMLLLQEKEDVVDRKQPEVVLAVSVNLESLASTSLISLPTTTSGKEL
jgi:hypothetical protein